MTDEALRLIDAAQRWVRHASAEAGIATGAPVCRGCPLCQAIAVLRGDRPDVTARLVEVAIGLADVVRGIAEAHTPPATENG